LKSNYVFTSESVSRGHPDKVADQISDALLDEALRRGDNTTRVAIETLVTTNSVTVAGEVKNFNLSAQDVDETIRRTIEQVGYPLHGGFDYNAVSITNLIHSQSVDIARGTDDFGAGDQGIMFGYACRENADFMPTPIYLAHQLLRRLDVYRGELGHTYLRPDAKSQISVEYANNAPGRIAAIVCSHQHEADAQDQVERIIRRTAYESFGNLIDDQTVWHINPTGNFVIGGPDGDAGVTGRKIIVDTLMAAGLLMVVAHSAARILPK
jgi:S-adenosylmethionine synthetase